MIRSIIKEQLEKCQFADLNNFDPTTNTFYIKKYSKPTYELNRSLFQPMLWNMMLI